MADHYLMKLILAPHLADPVKEAPDVHKHFTRYSKGSFDGPVIKVSKTKAKISVWASHEYEDLLLRFALKNCQDEKVKVTGNIIGGINFAPLLKKLDFPESWNPVAITVTLISSFFNLSVFFLINPNKEFIIFNFC